MNAHLEAALAFVARGWAVFPGEPGTKRPWARFVRNGYLDATRDPEQARRWWTAAPNAPIAVACEASRVVVVDADVYKPDCTFFSLEERLGALPPTLRQNTPQGGRHFFFKDVGGIEYRNAGPGVEVKHRGYVLAAPSLHPNGRPYVFENPAAPIVDLPDAWLAYLTTPTTHGVHAPAPDGADAADSRLGKLFAARGMLGALLTGGKRIVRCPWENEHTGHTSDSATVIFAASNGYGEFACLHAHCTGRRYADVVAVLAPPRPAPKPQIGPDEVDATEPEADVQVRVDQSVVAASDPKKKPPPSIEPRPTTDPKAPRSTIDTTDLRNADRLVEIYGDELRCVGSWGAKYLTWNASHWAMDLVGGAVHRAKEVARIIAAERKDDHWSKETQQAKRIHAMVQLAKSDPRIAITHHDLDRDPMLLNVLNGTIDLRTGILKPHNRADLITKLAPVQFDPDAKASRFEQFVREITLGDAELATFLQRFLGYCLTGSTKEEVFAFWYGTGGNGKSKLAELMLRIMGDYGCKAMPDILFRSEKAEKHETEIAHLHGRRLVVCNETKQGRTLDDGKIKDLTGSDTLTARRMREDPWSWTPTHKIVVFGQHKPTLRTVDGGMKRRTRLVPFAAKFEGDARDNDLPEKLWNERSGVLAWLVRGCLEWQRTGVGTSAAIDTATSDYFVSEDTIGQFLDAECIFADGAKITRKQLREAFESWCNDRGEKPATAKDFTAAVAQRPGVVDRSVRGEKGPRDGWHGIRLRTAEEREGEGIV